MTNGHNLGENEAVKVAFFRHFSPKNATLTPCLSTTPLTLHHPSYGFWTSPQGLSNRGKTNHKATPSLGQTRCRKRTPFWTSFRLRLTPSRHFFDLRLRGIVHGIGLRRRIGSGSVSGDASARAGMKTEEVDDALIASYDPSGRSHCPKG